MMINVPLPSPLILTCYKYDVSARIDSVSSFFTLFPLRNLNTNTQTYTIKCDIGRELSFSVTEMPLLKYMSASKWVSFILREPPAKLWERMFEFYSTAKTMNEKISLQCGTNQAKPNEITSTNWKSLVSSEYIAYSLLLVISTIFSCSALETTTKKQLFASIVTSIKAKT